MANKSNNLTAEQIKNIDSYKNDITHIEGTINAVRRLPGMYIGAINEHGLLTMFREIFQNAVDQLLYDKSPCNFISVLFDERTYKFVVGDNGLGIPFQSIVDIYTLSHTGKNLKEKKLGEYSAGINGIGAKATNALSEYFDVHSYRYDGKCKHILFKKGVPVVDEVINNPDKIQGTTVEFEPDHTVMGPTPLDPGIVYTLVRDTLSLLPIGSRIEYTSINKKGKTYHELMVNEDGINTNIIGKCSAMLIHPIAIMKDNGRMKLEMSFTFDQQDLGGEDITAYANMCPTSTVSLNSHVTGVMDGITTWFCNYMNKVYLSERDRNKIKVTPNDVKVGLKVMISAWHLEPQFTGQAKEVLSNQDFKPFAKETVMEALDQWAKSRPQDLLKVCKFLRDMAMVRIKADSEKVKVTAKYATSATTGLPAKYVRPSSKDPSKIELFIVEGDSALGSARSARNPEYQGVFPIRGKILNVFQATPQKIAANAEVMGIVQILGAGHGKNFDMSKLKVNKVIIMTDADNDGAHIADLLLLMCLKMFPGLVEAGKVFKAVPPLYGIPMGKNRTQYFAERVDFVRYMQREYYKKNTVTYMSKKPVDNTTFSGILLNYSDYQYDFDIIANRYKLNPILLEIVLSSYIKKEKFETLRKRITSEFRFMENSNITKMPGGTIRIKGLIDDRVETLFYNDRFVKDCEPIIEPIKRAVSANQMEFLVNGVKTGLFDLVTSAMDSIGAISRFKGLGEMNANQLAESTMSPDSRTLIQYTVNDINESIKIIRQYDSNKKMILQKIGDVDRSELIGL